MSLTGDGHVHSEWSWDTGGPHSDAAGRMVSMCRTSTAANRHAITIASDAHTPDRLGGNFYEAMAMAEHFGFRPGRRPHDFWTR